MPHLHLIGAGGIGVSAVGRYYKNLGWTVSGSDSSEGEITRDLVKEGFDIRIGHAASNLPENTDLVVNTESIFIAETGIARGNGSSVNVELALAQERWVKTRSYPQALGDITNSFKQIAVTGSHGKSSTTSLIGVMLAGLPNYPTVSASIRGSTIVGTKLAQFSGKNIWIEPESEWFAIEACEYKRHFLEYTPYVTVVTNIDVDHLDYYRDSADYLSAFVSLIGQTRHAVILSRLDPGCLELYQSVSPEVRNRLEWYWVDMESFTKQKGAEPVPEGATFIKEGSQPIPHLHLQIPGEHLRLDANLAYVVGELVGISPADRILKLEGFRGSWRRSEIVGTTVNGNLVLSDYGHHPGELKPTFEAIKKAHADKKVVAIFQPHQAARTRSLLEFFATSFGSVDQVIIPNIYLSRDSDVDIAWMTMDRLVAAIANHQPNVQNGHGLEQTAKMANELDTKHPGEMVFLLQGAGNIDELRYSFIYRV